MGEAATHKGHTRAPGSWLEPQVCWTGQEGRPRTPAGGEATGRPVGALRSEKAEECLGSGGQGGLRTGVCRAGGAWPRGQARAPSKRAAHFMSFPRGNVTEESRAPGCR